MRTTEEILNSTIFNYNQLATPLHSFKFNQRETNLFSDMINEARKEAIEECAERAKIICIRPSDISVDKESILSLINELK